MSLRSFWSVRMPYMAKARPRQMAETAMVTVKVVTYAAMTPLNPLWLPPTSVTSCLRAFPALRDCTTAKSSVTHVKAGGRHITGIAIMPVKVATT